MRKRESTCRPFSIADAMILVAATAVGIGVVVIPGWVAFPDLGERGNAGSRALAYSATIGQVQLVILPFLAAWTIALSAIRLRSRRPGARRCAREPGMMACSAASVAILVNAGWMLVLAIAYHPDPTIDFFVRGNDLKVYADRVGFAVIGAWVSLILIRGWNPKPCWIDRMGRLLGCLWVGMIGIHLTQYVVHAHVNFW